MLQFNVVDSNRSCSIVVGAGCPAGVVVPVPVLPALVVVPVVAGVVVVVPVVPVVGVVAFGVSVFSGSATCSPSFKFPGCVSCSPGLVSLSSDPATGNVLFPSSSAAAALPLSFKNVTVPTAATATIATANKIAKMVFVFPFILTSILLYFFCF